MTPPQNPPEPLPGEVEQIARILCRQHGDNPDDHEPGNLPVCDGREKPSQSGYASPWHYRWRDFTVRAEEIAAHTARAVAAEVRHHKAPHLVVCNAFTGPIGCPGCICVVVNKNQSLERDQEIARLKEHNHDLGLALKANSAQGTATAEAMALEDAAVTRAENRILRADLAQATRKLADCEEREGKLREALGVAARALEDANGHAFPFHEILGPALTTIEAALAPKPETGGGK